MVSLLSLGTLLRLSQACDFGSQKIQCKTKGMAFSSDTDLVTIYVDVTQASVTGGNLS